MFDLILAGLVLAMIATLVMAFLSFDKTSLWLMCFVALLVCTFVFIFSIAYNAKSDLYFTDIRGNSYVYKNVKHFSQGRNEIIYFTDENGNDMQFNIASLKQIKTK